MTTAIVNKELNVADMAWQRALVRLHVDETTKQGQHNLARDRSMTSGRILGGVRRSPASTPSDSPGMAAPIRNACQGEVGASRTALPLF